MKRILLIGLLLFSFNSFTQKIDPIITDLDGILSSNFGVNHRTFTEQFHLSLKQTTPNKNGISLVYANDDDSYIWILIYPDSSFIDPIGLSVVGVDTHSLYDSVFGACKKQGMSYYRSPDGEDIYTDGNFTDYIFSTTPDGSKVNYTLIIRDLPISYGYEIGKGE